MNLSRQLRLRCIICENGDPYSNIVCDGCECSIELRKDTYDYMVQLVLDVNNLHGDIPYSMMNELRDQVEPIYKELCKIKVNDTRNIV